MGGYAIQDTGKLVCLWLPVVDRKTTVSGIQGAAQDFTPLLLPIACSLFFVILELTNVMDIITSNNTKSDAVDPIMISMVSGNHLWRWLLGEGREPNISMIKGKDENPVL